MAINFIEEYHEKIWSGKITAGKWIKLWYEYVVSGLSEGRFFYDDAKAQKAIRYVETFCRHHEGALAPQLIVLELWQKAFLSVVFGIVDANGFRQFTEIVLIIGRKNGKTLFAAAIASYCTFADGEYGARIYFTAPKLEQAALCYEAYYQMISKDEELDALAKRRRTDIYVEENNASAKPLPFICWLYLNDEAFAADGVAYFSTRRVHVELYTEYVDFALEQKLEDVLKKAGLFFTKSMEYIESEGCYQTSYEMEI